MDIQYTATLRNWHFEPTSSGVFCVGLVFGDKGSRFEDGDQIRTSPILPSPSGIEPDVETLFFAREGKYSFIRTRNSIYRLEGPETT